MEPDILQHLSNSWESGEHSDSVVRLISNGSILRVLSTHRIVLSRSPFFSVQLRWGGGGGTRTTPSNINADDYPVSSIRMHDSHNNNVAECVVGSPTALPRAASIRGTPLANSSMRDMRGNGMAEFDLDVGIGEDEVTSVPWTISTGDTNVQRRASEPHSRALAVEDAIKFLCKY